MLFQRRHKPAFTERVRVMLWPRRGWRRSTQYVLKRMLRLNATPHAIAIGVAAGVFVSFTPFVGLHVVLSLVFAWIAGGNLVAAAFGTFIGNPVTFPFIWLSTYKLGNWMLGNTAAPPFHFSATKSLMNESFDVLWPLIKPMTVAGVPAGILCGLAFYFPVRFAIEAYQKRRRARLDMRNGARSADRRPGPGKTV